MSIAPIFSVILALSQLGQAQWTPQTSGTSARLRGVSAPGGGVVWACGAKGTCLRTTDDGKTWQAITVPEAAGLDFRDVHAVDARTATLLAIGAGPLSQIRKTTDGGATWITQITMSDPRDFLDAIAFADAERGLALGDPVDGHFTILRTVNGGQTWDRVPAANLPPALPGEGAFAASGTCLTILPDGLHAWFATGGGASARVFRSVDGGLTWTVAATPIRVGNASSGIFSIAFRDPAHGVAVGGDYRAVDDPTANLATTDDGGLTWTLREGSRPGGFRSAVAFVPGASPPALVAVGPSGGDVSADEGRTWRKLELPGAHAFSFGPTGLAGWGVGEDGRVGRLDLDPAGARSREDK